MSLFPVLVFISPQCSLAFSCVYACAYTCVYLSTVNERWGFIKWHREHVFICGTQQAIPITQETSILITWIVARRALAIITMNWNVILSFYICLIVFAGQTKFPIFYRRMWFTSLLSFLLVHLAAIFEQVMKLLKLWWVYWSMLLPFFLLRIRY